MEDPIMYIAVDVQYAADDAPATVAGVLFRDPLSHIVDDELVVVTKAPKPYVPRQFYQREMPCILELMKCVTVPIEAIFIDGYVDLGAKPGLGRHRYHALQGEMLVIGVAKRWFRASAAIEVKLTQSTISKGECYGQGTATCRHQLQKCR